jgi:hypothetical protein
MLIKEEILEALQDLYGTSEPDEVSESERWYMYENMKSNIRNCGGNPDEYTRQIILISEVLKL